MADRFLRDESLVPALDRAGIRSVDAFFALAGDPSAPAVVTMFDLAVAGTCGRFHYKRYHYPGWRKARGLIGRGTLFGVAPEINEFRALSWLRDNGLPAVRPVAAASRTHDGRLVMHALMTEHVPDTASLAARLGDPEDALRHDRVLRLDVAELLGRTVARMHVLGFVHRDLYSRNVLLRTREGDPPRIWMLDCRRGGTGRRKGPLHDLACLRLGLREGDAALGTSEWMRLLAAYRGSEAGLAAFDAEIEAVAAR